MLILTTDDREWLPYVPGLIFTRIKGRGRGRRRRKMEGFDLGIKLTKKQKEEFLAWAQRNRKLIQGPDTGEPKVKMMRMEQLYAAMLGTKGLA